MGSSGTEQARDKRGGARLGVNAVSCRSAAVLVSSGGSGCVISGRAEGVGGGLMMRSGADPREWERQTRAQNQDRTRNALRAIADGSRDLVTLK